jgi:hypothetical protein
MRAGDVVTICSVPDSLLAALPEEDRAAMRACVGKRFSIEAVDADGNTEIEFTDDHGCPHTIWIHKSHLCKIAS